MWKRVHRNGEKNLPWAFKDCTRLLHISLLPRDIIIFKCTKIQYQMVYRSWGMVCDRCNFYFLAWPIFFSFHPSCPTAQKIKMGKKWKKNSLRYNHFTHIYQKLWSDDVQFLRNGVQQTDRWTDGKSDIGVDAPPFNIPLAECIIEPLQLCLSCNNSIFNKQHYLVGTAEGLKALPCTPTMFKLWVMYLL